MASSGSVQAQGQPTTVTIGFRNDTKNAVIVQGTSVIKGVPRRGQPLLVDVGKTTYENNVPAGVRLVSVYDGAQPSRVLLRDYPLTIGQNDLAVLIRSHPTNSNRVILVIQEVKTP